MRALSARLLLLSTMALALLCGCGALCGCGTPGVPQPPSLNLAKPVSDLKATRGGDEVTLTWTVPKETTDRATFRRRGPTKVCQAIDQPQIPRCNVVVTLNPSRDQKVGTATLAPPSANGPNDYATYAVEVDNDRGRNAGLSNQVQVPTAIVSKLNASPSAQSTSDAVLITANIAEQGPAVAQRLELRRKERGSPHETTVAQRQLEISTPNESENVELRDDNFVWEKTYEYRVVVVASVRVPNGTTVTFDGATSMPLEVFVHDIFPPLTPTGLQAVFTGQNEGQQPSIDLTWNPDTDRDLAGYFVYRRRQEEPASSALKLNAQPVTAPAFHDTGIQPGNTYVYSVSAVDERHNESNRSEETSEQVPKL